MRLETREIPKVWGRAQLPAIFGKKARKEKIGEIWFEPPGDIALELLVKYLFTSEKLSVQVHPDNRQASKRGLLSGKEECWFVLDAEPGAMIGLGLTKEVRPAKLRAAAATGAIEKLIDWKPVAAGDFFYVPAGTVHAIGPGLSLVEIQQNADVTYRLYDYGRPRELHLDDAVAVANPDVYDMVYHDHVEPGDTVQLLAGPQFQLWHIAGDDRSAFAGTEAGEWHVVPLAGEVVARDERIAPGQCGIATSAAQIDLTASKRCLIACTMDKPRR